MQLEDEGSDALAAVCSEVWPLVQGSALSAHNLQKEWRYFWLDVLDLQHLFSVFLVHSPHFSQASHDFWVQQSEGERVKGQEDGYDWVKSKWLVLTVWKMTNVKREGIEFLDVFVM